MLVILALHFALAMLYIMSALVSAMIDVATFCQADFSRVDKDKTGPSG